MGPTLKVNVDMDGSGMERGQRKVSASTQEWAKSMRGYIAGAFSVGAISSMINSTAQYFEGIVDASNGLGIIPERMMAISNAAALAGKSVQSLEKLLNGIEQGAVDALNDPESKAGKSFQKMGISREELNTLTPSQRVERMGQALQGKTRGQVRDMTEGIVGTKSQATLAAVLPTMANLTGATAAGQKRGDIPATGLMDQLDIVGDEIQTKWKRIKILFAPLVLWIRQMFSYLLSALESGMAVVTKLQFGLPGMSNVMGRVFGMKKRNPEEAPDLSLGPTEKELRAKEDKDRELAQKTAEAKKRDRDWLINSLHESYSDANRKLEASKSTDLKMSAGPSMASSNFAGYNTKLIDNIAGEQLEIQKRIEKNTAISVKIQENIVEEMWKIAQATFGQPFGNLGI